MGRNADVVRRFFEAFKKRDVDTAVAVFSDDIVFTVPGNNRIAGRYEGRDAWLGLMKTVMEITGGSLAVELHALTDDDAEHAIALVGMRADRDGTPFVWPRALVYHIQDGRIAEVWVMEGDQATADAAFA